MKKAEIIKMNVAENNVTQQLKRAHEIYTRDRIRILEEDVECYKGEKLKYAYLATKYRNRLVFSWSLIFALSAWLLALIK